MTSDFHDILAILCTDVTLLNENETQVSFSLSPAKEAQLAYDILTSHGFDARVYHENTTSKLYINYSTSAPSEEKLNAALSNARTVRHILDTLHDAPSTDYHVSFTNTPEMGKQISIYFPPRVQALPTPAQTLRPTSAARPRPTAYSTSAATQDSNRHKRLYKKPAVLAEGPTVAKKTVFVSKGFRGWLHNYFVSHVAESFLAFCAMFFLAIFVLSIIITSKGYLCPDLAVTESKAWYCNFKGIRSRVQKTNPENQPPPEEPQ